MRFSAVSDNVCSRISLSVRWSQAVQTSLFITSNLEGSWLNCTCLSTVNLMEYNVDFFLCTHKSFMCSGL